MTRPSRVTISVDVGGTFTDALLSVDGRTELGKAPTTPYNLTEGVLAAIREAGTKADMSLGQLMEAAEILRYSTTIGTNALIQRVGPRLGLITTRGFEDVIHLGKSRNWADGLPREQQLDRPRAQRPPDLIPFELRVGVQERIDCFGNVVMPLRREEVLEKVQYLVDRGVRGIVVCLLWSFLNPVHERQVRDIIREEYPETFLGKIPVLLSSDVSPVIGEYKRTVTTVLDAFLSNAAEEHFLDLTNELRNLGYRKSLMVVRNTGGVSSISRATPLHLLGAGPVAGVSAAKFLARLYGWGNVMLTDMGGTSFDFGVVLEGQERMYEFDPVIDRWRVQLPIVATTSIGAGGGSVASFNGASGLRVGPASAGAVPGPVAYGKGGTEPTVTDADLVLGYIDPDFFLGGRVRLDRKAAADAIRAKIAGPMGKTEVEAAYLVRKMIDGIMGQEVFKQTALTGLDPREFTMFAVGGAGPVHACSYAEYADVSRIATFPFGALFNAFGASTMDLLQSYERTRRVMVKHPLTRAYLTDYALFNDTVHELHGLALRDMSEEGFDLRDIVFQLELEAKYPRQFRTVRIAAPSLRLASQGDVVALCQAFEKAYSKAYGQAAVLPEDGLEITLFRLNALAVLPKPELPAFEPRGEDPAPALKGRRPVFWNERDGFVDTPVFDREHLRSGNIIMGPALIEAVDTVCAVSHGWKFAVDRYRSGIIEKLR